MNYCFRIRKTDFHFQIERRTLAIFVLDIIWLLGLVCGLLFSSKTISFTDSLMRSRLMHPVSIVGLAVFFLLPVFSTVLVLIFQAEIVACMICFLKAFLFGHVASALWQAQLIDNWLIGILILHVDFFLMPVLFWCWMHTVSRKKESFITYLFLILYICSIWIIQFSLVLPIQAILIDY